MFSPISGMLVISLVALVWSSLFGGVTKKHKHKLARSRWATRRERRTACRLALKQMKKRKRDKVALAIHTEPIPKPLELEKERIQIIPKRGNSIYLPDANRGILVLGEPGSGKSYYYIDALIRSIINQGFPLILYDNKYQQEDSQTAKVAAYAIERGYKVHIFAPGFPESSVFNPLDAMNGALDGEMAREIGIVFNANFRLVDGNGESNPFFTNAAINLIQALLMAVKKTSFGDFKTASLLNSFDNLPQRIENSDLDESIKSAFQQLIEIAPSKETAASIKGTVAGFFSRICLGNLLPSFCGKSTIPLDLQGRQLVIFGLHDENRNTVSPIVATAMHILLTHNLAKSRTEPLGLFVDELPTIYLPSLKDWLNQKRQNGLVTVAACQNFSQLIGSYGESDASTIFAGCATKILLKTGDDVSARKYSNFLGEEEVTNPIRAKSSSKGEIQTHYEIRSRPLLEAAQFTTLLEGQGVIINPGFRDSKRSGIPLLHQMKMSPEISKMVAQNIQKWKGYRQQLARDSKQSVISKEEILQRKAEINRITPKYSSDESNQAGEVLKQAEQKMRQKR